MKYKLTVFITAVSLAFLLCSCGTSDDTRLSSKNNAAIGINNAIIGINNAAIGINNAAIEFNEDVTIENKYYLYDNQIYFTLQNNSDQPILNVEMAHVMYDENGLSIMTSPEGYKRGKMTAVNIMPGEKKQLGVVVSSNPAYTSLIITSIDYADGTTWSMDTQEISKWANSVRTFDFDSYEEEYAQILIHADEAESNPYALILNTDIKHGNPFSDKHDLYLSLENISDKIIKEIYVMVLEFDKNGLPTNVYPYNKCSTNGITCNYTQSMVPREQRTIHWDLSLAGSTSQIKTLIFLVVFEDGTRWENPYTIDWIKANSSSFK